MLRAMIERLERSEIEKLRRRASAAVDLHLESDDEYTHRLAVERAGDMAVLARGVVFCMRQSMVRVDLLIEFDDGHSASSAVIKQEMVNR